MRKKDKKLQEAAAAEVVAAETPKQETVVKKVKNKKKKKHKRTIVIILGLVLVIIVMAMSCSRGKDAAVVVTTGSAQRGSLQESVSTSGMVAAEEAKVFFAPVSGKIAEVKVAPGDAVKKGDVLVSYDTEKLESAFQQAVLQQEKSNALYNGALSDNSKNQAKIAEANTNLPVLEQQIADYEAYLKELQKQLSNSRRGTANALAGASYDLNKKAAALEQEIKVLDPLADAAAIAQKQEELKKVQSDISDNAYQREIADSSDYVASMEREIAEVQERIANCKEYKAEMESQKSGSEAVIMDSYDKKQYEADKSLAELSYEEAYDAYNMGKAGILAGFDGVVTEVAVIEGSTVAEGVQLLTLESSGRVKVAFNASKTDVEKLALGQKADIIISGNTYTGTVSKINRMASVNASNTPMVGVEIHIDKPDDRIILGLDAKLEIYTRLEEDALLVPVEAVNADKDGDFLYVAEEGIVVRKPILCGISNDTYTVVLEGITEQDQIILTSYGNLEEGMAVTILPAQ